MRVGSIHNNNNINKSRVEYFFDEDSLIFLRLTFCELNERSIVLSKEPLVLYFVWFICFQNSRARHKTQLSYCFIAMYNNFYDVPANRKRYRSFMATFLLSTVKIVVYDMSGAFTPWMMLVVNTLRRYRTMVKVISSCRPMPRSIALSLFISLSHLSLSLSTYSLQPF